MQQKDTRMESDHLIVTGFDFFGAGCSLGYSLYHDKNVVHGLNLLKPSFGSGLHQPSHILLNENGEVDCVGLEAEFKYSDPKYFKERGWRYFRNFTEVVYTNKVVSQELLVFDTDGNSMPFVNVIAIVIGFLASRLETESGGKLTLARYSAFVSTIPVTIQEQMKTLLHKAFVNAGFNSSKLRFFTDSESAVIEYLTSESPVLKTGTRILTVHTNEEETHVCVLQRRANASFKELLAESIGAVGKRSVLKMFATVLSSILSEPISVDSLGEHLVNVDECTTEIYKSVGRLDERMVNFDLCLNDNDAHDIKKISKRILSLGLGNKIVITSITVLMLIKLRVKMSIVRSWFGPTIYRIVSGVKEVLARFDFINVDTVLFVGDLYESKHVREAVERCFTDKTIYFPKSPGSACLKGCIIAGHTVPGICPSTTTLSM